VKGIGGLLQRSAGPTITIDTVFPLALQHVYVDANQFELALLNLVMNARDAMLEGGQIIIAAKGVTIERDAHRAALPKGDYVCLAVTDEGHGMDEDTLARSMEPFFTTKGVGKGTGLGLSMVHGLAEQSGGRLVLRSAVGRGTTAELWLPTASTPAEKPVVTPPISTTPRTTRALTIVVVDDDALIAMTMEAVLSDIGHRTLVAHSAQDALLLLEQQQDVDLLITDYAMPGINGAQLVEEVRKRWPKLRAILASGYAELPEGTAKDVIRLPKPFGRQALLQAVNSAAADSSSEWAESS
jgi:CheY-like chemotaxis protein